MVHSGVIEKFVVRVNPAAFGYRTALVLVKANNGITKDDVIQRVKQFRDRISCTSYGQNFCGCHMNRRRRKP
jgi:DNA-binding Lrp family transcriptional regulator